MSKRRVKRCPQCGFLEVKSTKRLFEETLFVTINPLPSSKLEGKGFIVTATYGTSAVLLFQS